jgi:lipopolysaccharide/colanic/teichoic acid biosynthesis glycosyltransferase
MSLVGPHPVLVKGEVKTQAGFGDIDAACKPGITGLWRFGRRFKDTAFYVRNWSPMLDVKIVVATLAAIVGRDETEELDFEAHFRFGLMAVALMIALIAVFILLG